jgi:hypothetical protein
VVSRIGVRDRRTASACGEAFSRTAPRSARAAGAGARRPARRSRQASSDRDRGLAGPRSARLVVHRPAAPTAGTVDHLEASRLPLWVRRKGMSRRKLISDPAAGSATSRIATLPRGSPQSPLATKQGRSTLTRAPRPVHAEPEEPQVSCDTNPGTANERAPESFAAAGGAVRSGAAAAR